MDYKDMIKTSARGGEVKMWDSIERVSTLLDELKKHNPEMVRQFFKQEYIALNGRHINEAMAHKLVDAMYHTNEDEVVIRGEAVTYDEAQILLDGKDDAEQYRYDAYVAANGFMHDLANTGHSKEDILSSARCFWFHDEDFSDTNKVFWYYEWMMF